LEGERIADQGLTLKERSEKYNWPQYVRELAPFVVLYLALAIYQIDDQSLWTDEVLSVNHAISTSPMWIGLHSQSPLYFLLLGLWSKLLGTTEFALRFFSAVLGVGAICLTYRLGLGLFDRKTAIFGAALLATSPYLIWYAQEARYITLLLFTSLAMTYSFHRALSTSGWWWWVVYCVTSALALFTFVTVVFLVIAHGLFLVWQSSGRPFLKKWVASQLMIMVAFAVWFANKTSRESATVIAKAPSVVSHEQDRSRDKLPVTDIVGTIPYTFFAFSVGFSVGPSLKELHESRSLDSLLSHGWIVVPIAVLFGSLFVIGLRQLSEDKNKARFLLLWLGMPIVGAFTVATLMTYHVYNTRYVALALPAFLIILAAGLAGVRRPQIQIFLFASLLVVNGISLSNYYFDARYAKADARATAKYIETTAQAGDIILAVGNATALRYYYKGSLPIETIDARGRNGDLVAQILRELVSQSKRLWLVEIRAWERDPKRRVKPILDHLSGRPYHKPFSGVDIYLYHSRPQ
jgi:mannosyltransferase